MIQNFLQFVNIFFKKTSFFPNCTKKAEKRRNRPETHLKKSLSNPHNKAICEKIKK